MVKTINAVWSGSQSRYVVDPAATDCDVAGTIADGWWSEDGDIWCDFGGGDCVGDFEDADILLVGGLRNGEMVS